MIKKKDTLPARVRFYLPDWNRKIHTELDGQLLCEDHKVSILETSQMKDVGEYRFYRRRPFIFINKNINLDYRAWVLFHEIGHFILHPIEAANFSDNVLVRRIETEAHIVAAVALIPFYILERHETIENLVVGIRDEFGYPVKLILFRKWVFDKHGF